MYITYHIVLMFDGPILPPLAKAFASVRIAEVAVLQMLRRRPVGAHR